MHPNSLIDAFLRRGNLYAQRHTRDVYVQRKDFIREGGPCKPRRMASKETKLADILILGF